MEQNKNEQIPKETYKGIVKFTLESMLDLSKNDKSYFLGLDLMHYYCSTIAKEKIITKDEFKEICEEVQIPKHYYTDL